MEEDFTLSLLGTVGLACYGSNQGIVKSLEKTVNEISHIDLKDCNQIIL